MSTATLAMRRVFKPVQSGRSSMPIWAALAVVYALSCILVAVNGGNLLTTHNLRQILVRSVALGLVTIGQTIVILAGSIDLSVAYTVSVSAVMAGVIMKGQTDRVVLGVVAVLALSAVIGLANGLVITGLKVNAFIATLGTSLIVRGFLNASFNNFSGKVPRSFQALGYNLIGPIPVSVLLLLAVAAGAWFLLHRTPFGYHVYAVGGSEEAARLSGVRSGRVAVAAHVLCSLCAGISGVFLVSRLGAGAPWVGPDGGYDLESIAAAVVGGTALAGGTGSVSGAMAGVLILSVIDSLFGELEIDTFLRTLVRGVIVVGAVALYVARTRKDRA